MIVGRCRAPHAAGSSSGQTRRDDSVSSTPPRSFTCRASHLTPSLRSSPRLRKLGSTLHGRRSSVTWLHFDLRPTCLPRTHRIPKWRIDDDHRNARRHARHRVLSPGTVCKESRYALCLRLGLGRSKVKPQVGPGGFWHCWDDCSYFWPALHETCRALATQLAHRLSTSKAAKKLIRLAALASRLQNGGAASRNVLRGMLGVACDTSRSASGVSSPVSRLVLPQRESLLAASTA